MNVKRSALNAAILMVVNGGAQAAFNNGAITSMTIEDVGSGGLNAYSPVLDNHSGHMHFSPINDTTYQAGNQFTGDVGPIYTSSAMAAGSFSSGFQFAGSPFIPMTQGPIVAGISYVAGDPEPHLTVTSLPWAGLFSNTTTFVLPPQATDMAWTASCGAPANPWLPFTIYWVSRVDATHVKYKIGWTHCITTAEAVGTSYASFNANWRLEGVATFSTTGDASPPAVFSVLPDNASTVAVVTANIVITYDEPMNPATVVAGSITVGGASIVTLGTPVASGNNTVFTFPITSGPLVGLGAYTITFNTGPKDVAGNGFTPTGPYAFTADVDTIPPLVASTTPANAATDVATNTNQIVVTFNEPMLVSSVVAGSVAVSGGVTVGAPTASNGNTVFTFPITSGPLTEGVTYTITIVGPTDISSNAVATTTSSFQTPAVVAPRVPTPIGSLGGGGCASNPAAPFNSSLLGAVVASLGYLGWRRKKNKS